MTGQGFYVAPDNTVRHVCTVPKCVHSVCMCAPKTSAHPPIFLGDTKDFDTRCDVGHWWFHTVPNRPGNSDATLHGGGGGGDAVRIFSHFFRIFWAGRLL